MADGEGITTEGVEATEPSTPGTPETITIQVDPSKIPEKFKQNPAQVFESYSELEQRQGQQTPSNPQTAEQLAAVQQQLAALQQPNPNAPPNQQPHQTPQQQGEQTPNIQQFLPQLGPQQNAPVQPQVPGQPTPPPVQPQPPQGIDVQALTQEFMQNNNQLSPETMQRLQTQHGLSEEVVKGYIEGVEARSELILQDMARSAGGERNIEQIVNWSGSALSPQERQVLQQQLQSGDEATMKTAWNGLCARFFASPHGMKRVDGVDGPSGQPGFQTNEEMLAAMNDEKYGKDMAYTESVQRRAQGLSSSAL